MSKFIYSNNNKRYHTLAYYNAGHGGKIFKAALDADFTCPNIDGTRGVGGCTYCSGGSGYFTRGELDVKAQLESEIARIRKKTPNAKICAYFQANSCTYGDLAHLKSVYDAAASHPDVAALAIGTRADCISEEIADLLAEYGEKMPVTVELGLQSAFDETAEKINRCHTFAEFERGFALLRERGIRICVHLINSLPGETPEMMRESARILGKMRPDAVKIHMLHIIKGTPMCDAFEAGKIALLSREEYVDAVISQLKVLPPETVIERLTGDGDKKTLTAPMWSADKIATLAMIDRKMAENDTYQGIDFEG